MSWAPEVSTDDSGMFYGNAVRFATAAEAEAWAQDRALRWTTVRATRVVESDDPVNYAWVDNRLVAVKP
jgi:hypothetical protein